VNHKERMLCALKLEKPDRVPKGEIMIHEILIGKLLKMHLPNENENAPIRWSTETLTPLEFELHLYVRELLGFDYVVTTPREIIKKKYVNSSNNTVIEDVWGNINEICPTSSRSIKLAIPDLDALKSYSFPEPDDFKYDNLKQWVEGSDLFVGCFISTGFHKICSLCGYESYMTDYLIEHRNDLHQLMERSTEQDIKIVRRAVEEGADCIWLGDDFAFNEGLFVSPGDLIEFDLQYMKKIVDEVHKLGKPVILHACGNMNKIIDDIVNTGVDGLHALQPSANNDIFNIKKKYTDNLCLIGNIDINFLLPEGSCYEVYDTVKEIILKVAPYGGYILSTCNMLNKDIPPENVLAMCLAAERYGKYPISF
jgi:uroporphyrinogen decarboxylase